jgi:hypothetical protein
MAELSQSVEAALEAARARREARRQAREAFAARRAAGLERRYRERLGLEKDQASAP